MSRVLKGLGCGGCPFEHASKWMVPDEVVEETTVFALAQNPGANEEAGKKIVGWQGSQPLEEDSPPRPFLGKGGWDLDRYFLPMAGLERGQISLGHTIRCRLGATNDLHVKPTVLAATAAHCERAYLRIPNATRLIVSVGATAWNHTQGRSDLGVYDWRGHVGPQRFRQLPVLATLSPEDLGPGRDPRMTLPTKMDWQKIPKILAGEYPKALPHRLQLGVHPLDDIVAWFEEAQAKASCVAWDTEYLYNQEDMWDDANYTLTMVSAAVPELATGVQMQFLHGPADNYDKREFIARFWKLLVSKKGIYHNAKAELRSTHKTWRWDWRKLLVNFEDTMLAHAARWSEWPHGLDFVESIYSPYAKIKHLPTTDPERNWGDTCLTLEAWKRLEQELTHDPTSAKIYHEQSKKLVGPTLARDMKGIRVNQDFVPMALAKFEKNVQDGIMMAQSAVGWPINLNSPQQLKAWLKAEGVKVRLGKRSRKASLNKDAVAELRQHISPFDAEWEAKVGADTEYVVQRILEGANPVLEARAFFVRADKLAGNYLRPLIMKED